MSAFENRAFALAALVGLSGCPGPPAAAACEDLCEVLIFDCGFAAYPDPDSCEQGCLYDVGQGGDVHGMGACVGEAACDTSEVLACSRTFGGAP